MPRIDKVPRDADNLSIRWLGLLKTTSVTVIAAVLVAPSLGLFLLPFIKHLCLSKTMSRPQLESKYFDELVAAVRGEMDQRLARATFVLSRGDDVRNIMLLDDVTSEEKREELGQKQALIHAKLSANGRLTLLLRSYDLGRFGLYVLFYSSEKLTINEVLGETNAETARAIDDSWWVLEYSD